MHFSTLITASIAFLFLTSCNVFALPVNSATQIRNSDININHLEKRLETGIIPVETPAVLDDNAVGNSLGVLGSPDSGHEVELCPTLRSIPGGNVITETANTAAMVPPLHGPAGTVKESTDSTLTSVGNLPVLTVILAGTERSDPYCSSEGNTW